jgi:hypothetical protein
MPSTRRHVPLVLFIEDDHEYREVAGRLMEGIGTGVCSRPMESRALINCTIRIRISSSVISRCRGWTASSSDFGCGGICGSDACLSSSRSGALVRSSSQRGCASLMWRQNSAVRTGPQARGAPSLHPAANESQQDESQQARGWRRCPAAGEPDGQGHRASFRRRCRRLS